MITLMFGIIFLLNLNYTILRSVRTTMAVADVGGSTRSIPFFELCVLPAACLMTWFLSYLLRIFSIRLVFFITLAIFVVCYVLFAFFYPIGHAQAVSGAAPTHIKFLNTCTLLFYILGELWKPALIQMLFWGLMNLNLPMIQAKRIYPSLILGASLGSILAGPVILWATSSKVWERIPISSDRWGHSFILMMLLVCIIGGITGLLFYRLSSLLAISKVVESISGQNSISLKKSIQVCFQISSLRWMCWIVLADYIAYALGEVIFLEILKHKFPNPCDYCRYMGHLSFWSSLLTILAALLVPFCVKKCRWITVALILPIALLAIESAFFLFLRLETFSSSLFGWKHSEWIACVVWLGSCQYCACRAIKYTFFDTSKELAFVALPKMEQLQGKLVIDGICARLGRGGSSVLSIGFISYAGGILASSHLAGITALGLSLSWVLATQRLNKQIDTGEVLHV